MKRTCTHANERRDVGTCGERKMLLPPPRACGRSLRYESHHKSLVPTAGWRGGRPCWTAPTARNNSDRSASFCTPAHASAHAPHTPAYARLNAKSVNAVGRPHDHRTGPLPVHYRGFVVEFRESAPKLAHNTAATLKNTMVSCGASVPQSHAAEPSQGLAVPKSRDTSTAAPSPAARFEAVMRAALRQGGQPWLPARALSCAGVHPGLYEHGLGEAIEAAYAAGGETGYASPAARGPTGRARLAYTASRGGGWPLGLAAVCKARLGALVVSP